MVVQSPYNIKYGTDAKIPNNDREISYLYLLFGDFDTKICLCREASDL